MKDEILHLARIEPRKVNNRQLQPSDATVTSHTKSLSEENISVEITSDIEMREQNEEVANAIALKLDRKAPLARVLAARGHSLESAKTLLQPASLEIIPDQQRMYKSGKHSLKQLTFFWNAYGIEVLLPSLTINR
ncbi:MAG: hypothetical protein ACO3XO_02585 [Bdellovibrionota bacterium]